MGNSLSSLEFLRQALRGGAGVQPSALGSDDVESPLQTESHQVSHSLRAKGGRGGKP